MSILMSGSDVARLPRVDEPFDIDAFDLYLNRELT